MSPKEIQEKLGINANRIKHFKKQGVFQPENPPVGNHTTKYSENDYNNLKFIVTLTKMGISCGDIKKIQEDESSLHSLLKKRKEKIEKDIKRNQSALSLLNDLIDDIVQYDTIDISHYWSVIQNRENNGEIFYDLNDVDDFYQTLMIKNIECPCCKKEKEVNLEDYVYADSSDERENGMGPDLVYYFDSENNYQCSDCESTIRINGWLREYPIGVYDSEEIKLKIVEEGDN